MGQTIIIAEAGVNHNGDIEKAKQLIDVAVDAGADYVKFQTFKTELNVTQTAEKANYQKKSGDQSESQFAMVKKLELSFEEIDILVDYCNSNGIKFLSTAFDKPSIDYIISKNVDFFKIPSGEITNYPYLKYIAEKRKPVVLSSGMAEMVEVTDAVDVLIENGLTKNNITVLHCNTEYPTPMDDVNLKAMTTIGKELNVEVGYSDHTLGIEVPIAAVALGAKVIEKHFTLDRRLPGPDHSASLEPDELKEMVKAIRNIEMAISGSGKKEPSSSELKNKVVARKSIHTSRALKVGELIKEDDLIALRPGNGISPMEWNNVIGRRVYRNYTEYEILEWSNLR